ncbi:ABC transporter substrate-binding protein [Enterocloster lavalensis]|uniref:ABC transporter substrate-binding protein n=1 Tax=Enterocloster lavalensis TaxID=460384 RepID=UPI001D07EBF3|nr:extracellular solute-binding protein [Enterocloster lavalensis]MCB6341407.1 extracellular solute-binding protein [Enterocloster lavalensis]
MMKKRIAGLIAGCMALSLAACGGTATDQPKASGADVEKTAAAQGETDGPVKLVVWTWDLNFNVPIMQKAGEMYHEKNPNVEIEVIDMAQKDVETKMVSGFMSGVDTNMPDILLIEDYRAKNYIQSYPGKYVDLTEEFDWTKFAPYKVNYLTIDDRTYGVPFDSGVSGLFYRVDLIEQAGYTKEDMNNLTYAEFIEVGKKVKEVTGSYWTAIRPALANNYFEMAMQAAGTGYVNSEGELDLVNNKALREALETLKAIDKSGFNKPVTSGAEGRAAIANGEVGAELNAVWFTSNIMAAEDTAGKWAVAPMPSLTSVPEAVKAGNNGGSSWFVLESSPHKEAAIEFLRTMYAGDEEFYQQILTERGAVGTYLPSQSGSAYEQPVDFFGGQKIYADFSKWMTELPGIYNGDHTSEVDDALFAVTQDYFDGKLSLDEALAKAEKMYHDQVGE